ncbi:hypothetical protein [Alcaligenes sp. Marseille-Q7550]|nr:hypothetical protein [Escherichia coli]
MGKLDHGTMCIMCQTLPLSKPHTSRHINMHPLTRLEDFGQDGAESLYRCSVCHTHWLYQKDKWHACLGFKLWPGDLHSYRAQERAPRSSPSQFAPQKIFRGPVRLN